MADDGPVPMDLGNIGTHDTEMTQNDFDPGNDMSHEDVCAIAWKGHKANKGAGKKGPNGSGTWHHGKGAVNGRVTEARKKAQEGLQGSKPDCHSDKDKGSKGKGKGKGKGKSETRHCCDCRVQGHIEVNCPYKTPDEEGEWCWPEKSKVTRW